MFERYTEKARRVIFFARYEAGQFGSPMIEPEHILLGILREDPALMKRAASPITLESVAEVARRFPDKINHAIDLPLSHQSRRVLDFAADEAETLGTKDISPTHLLLGLLRDSDSVAAKLLRTRGADLHRIRGIVSGSFEGAAPLYCPRCAESVSDPLTCGDCSAVICRRCGTPLESADDLGIG